MLLPERFFSYTMMAEANKNRKGFREALLLSFYREVIGEGLTPVEVHGFRCGKLHNLITDVVA